MAAPPASVGPAPRPQPAETAAAVRRQSRREPYRQNDTASNPAVPDFREILRWFSPNLPPNRNFASGRPKKHFLLAGLQVDAPYWEWRRKEIGRASCRERV